MDYKKFQQVFKALHKGNNVVAINLLNSLPSTSSFNLNNSSSTAHDGNTRMPKEKGENSILFCI